MSDNLIFRPMLPSDAQGLAYLYALPEIQKVHRLTAPIPEFLFLLATQESDRREFVATTGAVMPVAHFGFIEISLARSRAFFFITVHPDYQRRGIGRQCHALTLASARELGLSRLFAFVDYRINQSWYFLQDMGWGQCGEIWDLEYEGQRMSVYSISTEVKP